jgi:hypothetical protein
MLTNPIAVSTFSAQNLVLKSNFLLKGTRAPQKMGNLKSMTGTIQGHFGNFIALDNQEDIKEY